MNKRRRLSATVAVLGSVAVLAACGGGGDNSSSGGGNSLRMLIASSGDAETTSVREAAQKWASANDATVDVQPAQNLQQQLGQGFAGGNPPDVFYVEAGNFGDFANQGSLYAYGDQLTNKDDYFDSLKASFTFDGKFYCAPKDFSTLALVINTDLWKQAGLGDADIPTTWAEFATVAKKLTTDGRFGVVIGDTRDRIGAYMVQAGGWILDGTTVTADSPENLAALNYVRGLLKSGSAAYPTAADAGWGGEALGLEKAAMTVEGNWIKGAARSDYPDLNYTVVELPAGPAGKGTLLFTTCWGIAEQSKNKEAAVSLVEALTTPEQQMAFAEAFGVMPSLETIKDEYAAKYPEDAAFIAGGAYGQGPVNYPGMGPVLAEFDTGLQGMPGTAPQSILSTLQKNAEAVVNAG